MKHVLGIFGLAAASVLLFVSGAMNWQFGYQLGTSEANGAIFGFASASSDVLKALLPFFIFAAVRNKSWSQVAAGGALWTVCLAFSLTSALGFSAMNRKNTAGDRTAQTVNYQDLRTELARSRERLSWIPEHRPVATVTSEIEGVRQGRRWRATDGCTNATASKSISYCQNYHLLMAEAAAGREGNKIEAQIAAVKAKLAIAGGGAVVAGVSDPQASTIGDLIGVDESTVQMGLIVLMALLVEFGSALGFYVVFSQWQIYEEPFPVATARPRARESANDNRSVADPPRRMPVAPPVPVAAVAVAGEAAAPKFSAAPENDVERFYRDRVVLVEGSSLTATALYEEYCGWCDELSKEPLALPTFGRQFGDLGVNKAKIAGRIRYIGIKLTTADATGDESRRLGPLGAVQAA